MVSNELLEMIKNNKTSIGEPYLLKERVIEDAGQAYVNHVYMNALVTASVADKAAILDRMYQGWIAFGVRLDRDHLDVRKWGRATIGLGAVCRFTNVAEVRVAGKLDLTADVIVRISRWFHSTKARYGVMNPEATYVVKSVWGNIEDLRRMPSVCHGALKEGKPRSRPNFRFKSGVGPTAPE